MKTLLPYLFAFITLIGFSGCDSSDEEILQLISINAIEGKWEITYISYEVYQNGDKITGHEDENPSQIISFYGGNATIEGEDDVYKYTISTNADGKEYITMVRNNSRTTVFELTELNLESMKWNRDEVTTDFNGQQQREVESTFFKKIKE